MALVATPSYTQEHLFDVAISRPSRTLRPTTNDQRPTTDDPALFQEWIVSWGDLVEFEIVPITESKATSELMRRLAE